MSPVRRAAFGTAVFNVLLLLVVLTPARAAQRVDGSVVPSAARISSRGAAGTSLDPMSSSFLTPSQGWVLGTLGCPTCVALATTSDGGKTWAELPRPPVTANWPSPNSGSVSQVSFADRDDGFLYGPGLYVSHDGGKEWSRTTLTDVVSVSSGAGVAYALTSTPSAVWRDVVGSNTWSRVTLPTAPEVRADTPNTYQLSLSGSVLLLLLEGFSGQQPGADLGALWMSTSGGRSWVARPLPCKSGDGGAALSGIALDHPNEWFVDCFDNEQSSQEQNTQHHLYESTNSGAVWERLSDPSTHGEPALLAANGSGDAVLTVEDGFGGLLSATSDGGREWRTRLSLGGNFSGFAGLEYVNSSTAFVIGPTHYVPGHLYRSDDGGKTWRVVVIALV